MKYNWGIDRPMFTGYCEKCMNQYLLDGGEARCSAIKMGNSDVMCVQVVKCYNFLKEGE